LGVVGYYLLTGKYVFEGESAAEICRKSLVEDPVPPSVRIGRVFCPHIEGAIMRCLERDPATRPQTAHELIGLLSASPRAADWTIDQSQVPPAHVTEGPPSLDIAIADRVA
jgi:serine/threonine-protein kinase